jgi:hypothetical protein
VSITQEHSVSLALNEYGTAFYLDPTHFPALKSLLYLQLANVKSEERNFFKTLKRQLDGEDEDVTDWTEEQMATLWFIKGLYDLLKGDAIAVVQSWTIALDTSKSALKQCLTVCMEFSCCLALLFR